MSIKNALSALLGSHVIDKKDSHSYSKKLDFNLYSKICFGVNNPSKSYIQKQSYLPKNIDLGGSMIIILKENNGFEHNVICSPKNTIREIMVATGMKLKYGGKILKENFTLDNYGIGNGDVLHLYEERVLGAGGVEFYIDDDLLDPSYDYDFRGTYDGNKKFYRGGLEYKRPCGWKRYALKVNGKYENDSWLGSSGNANGDSEWAISYHGTKQEFFKSIYINGYRPGHNNKYGVGIYCTPNIETAAAYSKKFIGDDGKTYKLVLQNRVRPSAIKKASVKGGPDDYWYIENGKDIRPYSICVRECK